MKNIIKQKDNGLLTKLKFPILALLVLALIYGVLLIGDLKKDIDSLNAKTSNLNEQLITLQTQTSQIKDVNSNLASSLNDAQKKIVALQNQTGVKKVAGVTTVYQPVVTTNTITKTVTQEIEKKEAIQATVTVENVGSFKIDLLANDNAFEVLKRAASQNNFALDYDTYSFGVFVKSIGGIAPKGNQYWAFYFNGAFSQVGASDQPVTKGDSIFWQLASF